MEATSCKFSSLDGTNLRGDFVRAHGEVSRSVLLIHGAGVDRTEDGFYDQAMELLAAEGLGVFRFDLRGHGESDGSAADLTLAGALSDIMAAFKCAEQHTQGAVKGGLGASFGGGMLALSASKLGLDRFVFINPLLKFRKRFLEDKSYWTEKGLNSEEAKRLQKSGALQHVGPIMMNQCFINEVFWLDPYDLVRTIPGKSLVFHGTLDSSAPYSVAQDWAKRVGAEMITFEGAEHGLCMPGDDEFEHPMTVKWQASALSQAAKWLRE